MQTARLLIVILCLCGCMGSGGSIREGRPLDSRELAIWYYTLDRMQQLDVVRIDSDDGIPPPVIREAPGPFVCGGGEAICACRRSEYIELCSDIVDSLQDNEYIYAHEFTHYIIAYSNDNHLLTVFKDQDLYILGANELF